MRANDPVAATARCASPGSGWRATDGRAACNVPLWLDEPSAVPPGAQARR